MAWLGASLAQGPSLVRRSAHPYLSRPHLSTKAQTPYLPAGELSYGLAALKLVHDDTNSKRYSSQPPLPAVAREHLGHHQDPFHRRIHRAFFSPFWDAVRQAVVGSANGVPHYYMVPIIQLWRCGLFFLSPRCCNAFYRSVPVWTFTAWADSGHSLATSNPHMVAPFAAPCLDGCPRHSNTSFLIYDDNYIPIRLTSQNLTWYYRPTT